MNLVMALKMGSWTACVLLVCVGLIGEGELFAFSVGWVTEKGRLSDKEKKKLFLVCHGLFSGTGLKDLERGVGTWAKYIKRTFFLFLQQDKLETELVIGH